MVTRKDLRERTEQIDAVLEILNELRAASEAEDIKEIDSVTQILQSLREVNVARLEIIMESEEMVEA